MNSSRVDTSMPATTRILRSSIVLVAVFLCLVNADVTQAQQIMLSPQQQAMLNQLPPAQRTQALEALRQLSQQNNGATEQSTLNESLSPLPQATEPAMLSMQDVEEEPRAGAGSRLVINFTPRDDLDRETREELESDAALDQLRGSHYFELDENGVLMLPGLPTIPLLGLTEESIKQRLDAEPALKVFEIGVALIGVESAAAEALEPFGYEVFESEASSFQPVTTGPVPPDYVLGPGDSVRVQLFGNVNGIYEFEVTRDGILNLPDLGPITVAGLPFSEFREDLNRRVEQMLIGTQVSVTMGQLRTIRVFVLGDVNRPGSYVVSSLATISSALYSSGGISDIGSLRDIHLKRSGKVATRLDLYDLLLRGDTSGDMRLRPGDVIFVPPIGATASVGGAVRRPAIYELKGTTSVAGLVDLAGGLSPEAFPAAARIERIDEDDERVVLSVDVKSAEGARTALLDGDVLFVPKVLAEVQDSVTLVGHVQRPGPVELRPGMRLTDLLPSANHLLQGADTGYVLIRREDAQKRVSVVSANLQEAWANPGAHDNLLLQSRDAVHVFSLAFGRQRVIEPLMEELQLQARVGEPFQQVSVSGSVKAPGLYPLEPDMRVSDLVRAGGNLAEEAYTLRAELARYEVIDNEYRQTKVIDVDLGAILQGNETADLALEEHDNLRISRVPDWDTLWSVSLEGEVRFPGEYRIRQRETLWQVVQRAGGLTDDAFPEGAIFLREALREREQEQINNLAKRLEADLTSLSLQTLDTTGVQALETGQSLLSQLRSTEAVGRLVIDLGKVSMRAGTEGVLHDLELRDGDRLLVSQRSQEVTVIGETQQSTSHLFQPGLSRDDYIEMSGGLTRRADKKMIYVVRASGAVVAQNQSRWFGRNSSMEIRPGDTIVVPIDTDRIRPLTFWTNVTQIIYQGAIAVAALRSFE